MQMLRAGKRHGENLSFEEGSLPHRTGLGRDQNCTHEDVPTPSGGKGIRIKIGVQNCKEPLFFSPANLLSFRIRLDGGLAVLHAQWPVRTETAIMDGPCLSS